MTYTVSSGTLNPSIPVYRDQKTKLKETASEDTAPAKETRHVKFQNEMNLNMQCLNSASGALVFSRSLPIQRITLNSD